MRKFDSIGYPLTHSFSPRYFEDKFEKEGILDCIYQIVPLEDIQEVLLLKSDTFIGLNVTIPYKKAILPYLDELDETAAEIGAVNCIKITKDGWKGYNTDAYGFEKSFSTMPNYSIIKQALILGTGGASLAVKYALKQHGIGYRSVSTSGSGDLSYREVDEKLLQEIQLIVNTSPIGMSPNVGSAPEIPYRHLTQKHFLFDLIYNPEKTLFLSNGEQMGCSVKNGSEMLIQQAEKSWQIWNNQ